ncbi:cupin domain-containing protein, partial [Halorubrum sp. CBA1125]|uniref:cupin domain-containing protein n=1 Tax=Halorubrum sp. CBA1125 TaxID=2668072 RepID=UPI0012E93D8B
MGYDTTAYDDVEPRAPGMYFLRDALDCEQLGVTVVEADDGWEGLEHDHAEDGQEEVYLLLHGEATLTVEGEAIDLGPGDAVRVDADSWVSFL